MSLSHVKSSKICLHTLISEFIRVYCAPCCSERTLLVVFILFLRARVTAAHVATKTTKPVEIN